MAKKKKKTTSNKRVHDYVGKVYLRCSRAIDVSKTAEWLSNNATLDIDYESGDACPFDDGVGIAIDWASLKETK